MDHLAGWTIAVTAEHRAAEQAALLQRRGAEVVLAPLVQVEPVADAEVRAATTALVSAPLDAFVATSALGVRSWLAMAWTWDLGDALLEALRGTDVHVRGAATAGVVVGEGLAAPATAAATLSEVLERLRPEGVSGRRIGVQVPGSGSTWFLDALRAEGAEVVPVAVYRVAARSEGPAADRLAGLVARGELDAVTCTSRTAVRALVGIDGVVDGMRSRSIALSCVGPGTAAAALEAGLVDVVVPEPQRLGSMIRHLGNHLAGRGSTVDLGGVELRHQGGRVSVDGHEVRLTPRERRVLEALLHRDGVLSKQRLAAIAWDEPVDAHTVEVAINRLRRKLGPAAMALETTNRRGYRFAQSG